MVLVTCQTFSDPPLNIFNVSKTGNGLDFHGEKLSVSNDVAVLADGAYKIGVRPHHIQLSKPDSNSMIVMSKVSTTEITGSESFIHIERNGYKWVALTHGVHRVEIGDEIPVYLNADDFFVFDTANQLVRAPSTNKGGQS